MSVRIRASGVAGPHIVKVFENLSSPGCTLWIPNPVALQGSPLNVRIPYGAWLPSVTLSRCQALEFLLSSCESPVEVLLSLFYL